jgi:hypothetical protein
VQSAVEAIRNAAGLIRPVCIRAVAWTVPKQTKGLPHLRLGFGGLTRIVGLSIRGLSIRPWQRARCTLLALTRSLVESKLYVFRQFNHPGELGRAKVRSGTCLPGARCDGRHLRYGQHQLHTVGSLAGLCQKANS